MANAKPARPAATIDAKLIRELAEILSDTGLTEIELERGDLRLRVAREPAPAYVQAPAYAHAPATGLSPAPAAAAPVAAPPPQAGDTVPSPMVGTVYLSPEPGAAAFLRVGDMVKAGDTLLLIEAMKTFNPIPAPRAGKVIDILVNDGQPVEFGEALVVLG